MRVPRLISPRDNELILYNALKRVTGGLPTQTGHAGEFLTTDGTDASWAALTGGGDMLAANNLSDVVSASTSLTNLGGLAAANNLSDVADAPTANNNLGNSHLTYTPTCTTIVGTGTMTPLADCFVIQVDSDSISFTFYFQIDLGGGETDGTFTFTLPPSLLPTNNFAANGDLQFVMGLPNAAQWTVDDVIGYNATVGAKTGSISYQSATAGDTKKITAFIRYHR